MTTDTQTTKKKASILRPGERWLEAGKPVLCISLRPGIVPGFVWFVVEETDGYRREIGLSGESERTVIDG